MKVKGFTLIELLIVMAIIAILVGIALPRFRGMQDEANIAKSRGELWALKTAVESYYMHNNNAYPAATTSLYGVYLSGASPKIIDAVLYDPFATTTGEYVFSRASNYYVIYSVGPQDGDATVTTAGVVTNSNAIFISNGTPISGG